MRIFKKSIFKILGRILLVIGVSASIIILPRLIPMILVKMIDTIFTDPIYDEEGKIIHQDGRKTIRSFGARKQFAIIRFSLDKNEQTTFKKARLSLYDRDNSKSLERDIEKYEEISPCLYVIGNKKGYTKLNYETGEVIQSKNINDFSEEDKEIFNSFED